MSTTRTSKADHNWYSISNNIVQLRAGTDTAETIGTLPPGSVAADLPDSTEQWDAYLKVCDNTNGVTFDGVTARQGSENAVDCNNKAHNCTFKGMFGAGAVRTGDQVITVKGGCYGLSFGGQLASNGTNAMVVVGAWSDQCHDISTDLDFTGLITPDGRPITFILARCARVKLPANAKVLRLKSLSYSIYWWAKLAALKLHLLPSK